MGTLRLICVPASGRGLESPAERRALAAFWKDRLRFAHPTGWLTASKSPSPAGRGACPAPIAGGSQ